MQDYGYFGKPCLVLEMLKDWRAEKLAAIDAGRVQQASPDGKADFAAFFDDAVTNSFYNGYERAESSWRRFVMRDAATDFKEKRIKGLAGISGFGYVGDLGEYPGLRRALRPEASIVVDTYGGVYQISRQAIRNDETRRILSTGPDEMGYGAGVFITEMIISLIVSNPLAPDGAAMYSAARGNQVTTVLDENSLVTAAAWMQNQRDDDGRPIRVTPTTLAVQNEILAAVARRILQSQGVIQRQTQAEGGLFGRGDMNAARGTIPADGIVVDPFFPDANDWYLFADPARVPGFAASFLDGQERPFIGLKDPFVRSVYGAGVDPYTFELDSLDYKVRFDVGAAPVDPRGVYRGTPA
jgi:Mu-like prophage major head subunit gpT